MEESHEVPKQFLFLPKEFPDFENHPEENRIGSRFEKQSNKCNLDDKSKKQTKFTDKMRFGLCTTPKLHL